MVLCTGVNQLIKHQNFFCNWIGFALLHFKQLDVTHLDGVCSRHFALLPFERTMRNFYDWLIRKLASATLTRTQGVQGTRQGVYIFGGTKSWDRHLHQSHAMDQVWPSSGYWLQKRSSILSWLSWYTCNKPVNAGNVIFEIDRGHSKSGNQRQQALIRAQASCVQEKAVTPNGAYLVNAMLCQQSCATNPSCEKFTWKRDSEPAGGNALWTAMV